VIIDGGKYIKFQLLTDDGERQRWLVCNKAKLVNQKLGVIEWYAIWMQYIFMPGSTYFNNTCLDTISAFLSRLNKEKRITKGGEN
jgi:hypothetical protein